MFLNMSLLYVPATCPRFISLRVGPPLNYLPWTPAWSSLQLAADAMRQVTWGRYARTSCCLLSVEKKNVLPLSCCNILAVLNMPESPARVLSSSCRVWFLQLASVLTQNRPLSRGGHFEFQENKKLCFCPSSLALDGRLDGQILLFQYCVIKFNVIRGRDRSRFTWKYDLISCWSLYNEKNFQLPAT